MYASVVINVASSNVDQLYEYYVPSELETFIQIGSRVNVEFGLGDRLVMGYVIDVYQNKKFDKEVKNIIEVLDLKPLITSNQLKIASFLKDDCICPMIRILNMMIPEALILKTYKYIVVKNSTLLDATLLDLFNGNSVIEVDKNIEPYKYKIQKEILNGNLEINYETRQTTNFKYITKYAVNMNCYYQFLDTLKNPLKKEFLREYINSEYLTDIEIIDRYGISLYMLNDLVKKGFLEKKRERTLRIKHNDVPISSHLPKKIDSLVSETIDKLDSSEKPYLYMPSSNLEKDEVLLRLIEKELLNNKTSVILCADILSSIKYTCLIRKKLEIEVACINSNLSKSEYLDYYTEILDNNYQVIVTTPKGAFLPYQNVGMYFMMDEESDNYFNDQSPRYDLHKTIFFISNLTNSKFIMESISPSVSDYCYGLKGTYTIVDNTNVRKNSNVAVVNMIDELKKGNNTYLSVSLENAILNAKKQNKQSLLLVNNKSYSNYVLCLECGDVPKCEYCGISLNYNDKSQMLICPACGKRISFYKRCLKCNSTSLRFGGVGIESIYEAISKKYPNLTVMTIDKNDSLTDFSTQMAMLEDNEVDVIITTETYAKAIVNNHINVVGIINFDSTLKTPSYDALSRAYNLLVYSGEQIKENNGMLYVQTTDVSNSALVNYIIGDYKAFLKDEITNRKLMHNEPFYHINRIIIKTTYEEMFKVASNIKNTLKELAGSRVFVIGPTYSKQFGGSVLIIKHNYNQINDVYKKIYEFYQGTKNMVIFDKYPKKI